MEEHPDSIVIIELLDIDNTNLSSEEIHRLATEHSNLYFDFYKMSEFRIMSNQYTEQKYMYHYPITSWIDLNYILHFPGLHAITIGEPLIFDIQRVRTLVDKSRENIQLRAYPTIGRPNMYNDFPGDTGLCHFWVLPQHCSIYDSYIDIFDILDSDADREKVLCDYYINGTAWLFGIDNFFKNMDTNIVGNYVLDSWAEKRLNCGQRCFMPSPTCHYCEDQDMMYDLIRAHPEILQ